MAEVNEAIVREYFETLNFLVVTNVLYNRPRNRVNGRPDIDLLVKNPNPNGMGLVPFVLETDDHVNALHNVAVEVKGWHGTNVVPSVIDDGPASMTAFINGKSRERAVEILGDEKCKFVLVISEFGSRTRLEAERKLQLADVDHVIEFPTILRALINRVETNVHYGNSEVLHTIRCLKYYGFIPAKDIG